MKPNPVTLTLSLVVLAVLSGCVSPPSEVEARASASPPAEAGRANATEAGARATVDASATYAAPVVEEETATEPAAGPMNRSLHLRVHEGDTLLYSSWPGEQGSLQAKPNNATPTPPEMPNRTTIPSTLAPLFDLWAASPPGANVTVEGYVAPAASFDTTAIPRTFTLPTRGAIPTQEATRLFGGEKAPGTYVFSTVVSGTLPLEVVSWGPVDVHYRFPVDGPMNFNISRAKGVLLHAEPQGATVRFALQAPGGAFESGGCQPAPGTTIPPGFYVIASETEREWSLERYSDVIDFGLQKKTLRVEAHFLKPEMNA